MMRRALTFVLVCLVLMAGTASAAAPNDPGWSQQWSLQKIHADRAWTKSKGSGVVVAVVDTGVDRSHPDLQGRLIGGVDLIDGGTPDDRQGHGTFMAGLISATTGNVEGVASVAPLAKIMPIRVLDENGVGKPSVVAQGIDWAVAHGAEVINLSLAQEAIGGGSSGGGGNLFADTSMDQAIRNAAASGAVVVAAAGNDLENGGHSTTAYDASTSGVIVVGASTKTDRLAAYSNYGSGLDVLAPGGGSTSSPGACDELGTVSTWWNPATQSSAYGSGCGTSMAVAHVSGIAALLVARGYSNASAVRRIRTTAVDLYANGKDSQSGYGRVDAAAAVGATTSSSPPRAKPKPKPRAPSSDPSRPVGAAATKPAVKGAKVAPPATPSPIGAVRLVSAGPFDEPPDPKLHMVALALAMAVGLAVAHTLARRSAYR